MKTVLFVPGFQENLQTRDYSKTINAIEARGYKVKFISINWRGTTIINWVKDLNLVYAKFDPKETVLAGFSYGAMTTFVTATKRNPSELWLFSLSPYFSEDVKSLHTKLAWIRDIGIRRVLAFEKLNFRELSKAIDCKVLLFAGGLELEKFPNLDRRIKSAHSLISNSELILAAGVGHNVVDPKYINSIVNNI